MSTLLSKFGRDLIPRSWPDWLPGWMALLVLATVLLLTVQREVTRGFLPAEREARTRTTAVVVVPLVLCAAIAVATRLLELIT